VRVCGEAAEWLVGRHRGREEAAPKTGPKNGPPVSTRGNGGSAGRTIVRADHRGRRCPYRFFRSRDICTASSLLLMQVLHLVPILHLVLPIASSLLLIVICF
jgi:hypothetical protein